MIPLYTPAAGFPNLDVKINYGLARVGIEAGCKFLLVSESGYYRVEFQIFDSNKFKDSFLNILKRLLLSNRFSNLGVKARYKDKYSLNEEVIRRLKDLDFLRFFGPRTVSISSIKKDMFCGHTGIDKFGGSSGLILLSSFHAGKPYEREKRFSTFNQSLCAVCWYIAILGPYSFAFIVHMGQGKNHKYAVVLPIPKKSLGFENTQMLMSLQKTLHNFWFSDVQPLRTCTIGVLAKVPSLNDIINELQLLFHLSLISKDNRGDTVIEETTFINAVPFSKFISSSLYNSATISKLLGSLKVPPKISPLIEITNILELWGKGNLPKFTRLCVQETSTDNRLNLLYPETTKYLLKEVAMIKPEIINNEALGSLARTLRYFIRERKYGYADDIRNAKKESKDFEETIAKMLRETELRRIQQEQDKKSGKKVENRVYLPKESEIKKVFQLANENFESTKIALVILAFTFPSKGGEDIETTEEVQNEIQR